MKIKNTKSLCPECGRPVDAEVYDEGGKVYIKKTCSVHGEFINTYWNDVETYDRVRDYEPSITSVENPSVDDISTCPSNCGLCSKHETSTVLGLIDVTNRCNLKCPVCFANAAASGRLFEPTQDEIRQMLKNLRSLKPHPTPAVQYAGGEPTVRKDIVELVKMAKDEGFTHVQIATNGLKLAMKENLAKELKDAGLNTVYLAFDGVTPEPYINNRGRDLLPYKLDAIENCRKAGLGIVLVPTLIKGVNDHQVGDIIKFAFDHNENIYGVNFQPVSFAGRTPSDQVEKQRITIPDFIQIIEDQTDGDVKTTDFYPPSSVEPIAKFIGALEGGEPTVTLNCHQHCGIATYVFREKTEGSGKDKLIPINDFIDVDGLFKKLDELAEKLKKGGFGRKQRVLASATKAIPKLIYSDKTPKNLDVKRIILNVFTKRSYSALGDFSKDAMLISCMHFMDPFNFDEDRVKKCVIHYATPDGRIIPFCTYNSMYRENVEEKFSTTFKGSKN
ncbi:tetraether lipid synthase Tes [Methanobrevibacter sp.]|uniref:tetraether lipid synthase Tes n=1 Tax=Methanobrevibacter sp. TaxID=66852 RepID=UPI0026000C8E|nr:radical SAM protein [Methanobrevibacter sp.]MEE0024508.1 radical SAM protein [Methanobrevibacter sp.]